MRKSILVSLYLNYDKIIDAVKNIKVKDQANKDIFFILIIFVNPVVFFISIWEHESVI